MLQRSSKLALPHTHKACLSSGGCMKNSLSAECRSPLRCRRSWGQPNLASKIKARPLGLGALCIPRDLIVKSQTLPLVCRLTQPQRHFINAPGLTLRTAAIHSACPRPCPLSASPLFHFLHKQVMDPRKFSWGLSTANVKILYKIHKKLWTYLFLWHFFH